MMNKSTVLFFFVFFPVLFAFSQSSRQSPEVDQLKCAVLVEDHVYVYGLNVFPSEGMPGLFRWEGVIKNFKTGETLALFRGKSMRGQENIFERVFQADGSKVTITTSVDTDKSKIVYRIQRSRGEQLLFSHEGEKEIFF